MAGFIGASLRARGARATLASQADPPSRPSLSLDDTDLRHQLSTPQSALEVGAVDTRAIVWLDIDKCVVLLLLAPLAGGVRACARRATALTALNSTSFCSGPFSTL